jgi:hypothetical protein
MEARKLLRYTPGRGESSFKSAMIPASGYRADVAQRLVCPGDGWLSEETPTIRARLNCCRVWIVDPLTARGIRRRHSSGISSDWPWMESAVAGGICNPRRAGILIIESALRLTENRLATQALVERCKNSPAEEVNAPVAAVEAVALRSAHGFRGL